MSTGGKRERVMSRGDAAAIWFFMIVGGALAVWAVVQAILRIVEVIPNRDVRVFAEFAGTMADAPIGPDGAPVAVELASGYLIAPELPVASVVALIIEQVIVVAAVVTVVTTLLLLAWNVLRGRVFSRTNTRLVATAGAAGLIGMILAPFFGNMGANGAFAWISEHTFDNVILTVNPAQLLGVAFLSALAGFVFSTGARLQRETELLV